MGTRPQGRGGPRGEDEGNAVDDARERRCTIPIFDFGPAAAQPTLASNMTRDSIP